MCEMKRCLKCEEEFPKTSEYFYPRKRCKDGFENVCNLCKSKHNKLYRDTHKAQQKLWEQANSEKKNIYQKKWIKEHPELYKARRKRRIQVHPMEGRIARQKNKASKFNLPATFTCTQWDEAKFYFDNKCAYCNKELPLEQDHFIALTQGGGYSQNNIIPTCRKCNSSKYTSDPFIWYPKQLFYSKSRETKILKYLGYKDQYQQLSVF